MYLKNIAIQNFGPFDNINIELPFNENESPKPVIFVGRNGSGKTILTSQITDAFYEIIGSLFSDVRINDFNGYKYYKLCGGINLKQGKESSFYALRFDNGIEYLDKTNKVEIDEIRNNIPDFKLNINNLEQNEKKITKFKKDELESKKNIFTEGIYFSQPAYRFEMPFWKNIEHLNEINFDHHERISNRYNRDFEIISSLKINKSFILNLVLDNQLYQNQNDVSFNQLWLSVNKLLRSIKQMDNIRFAIGNRKSISRISIVQEENSIPTPYLNSINNLSLGETLLLNMFVNIVRYGDSNPKPFDQMEGIVVIDEIDSHLHADMLYSVLPDLIKLFPKIQFILTALSPIFLLGMRKTFGDEGFVIYNLPLGNQILAENFEEFSKSYELFQETEKYAQNIQSIIQNATKPIVFVEGELDVLYIKKAAELLNKLELLSKVDLIPAGGAKRLDGIIQNNPNSFAEISSDMLDKFNVKILLLYDCDTNKNDKEVKNSVWVRKIPFVDKNPIKKGIENLFPESTRQKADKHSKKFIDTHDSRKSVIRGEELYEPKKYEINKDEKTNFCNWLCENGTYADFINFNKIFEIIEEFLN